jgi:hypothetical protein
MLQQRPHPGGEQSSSFCFYQSQKSQKYSRPNKPVSGYANCRGQTMIIIEL